MQKITTGIVLFFIKLYQKYLSPHKGFSCAYRLATNEIGCSGYAAKVIQKFGLIKGYKLLNRRFFDCKWHATHRSNINKNIVLKHQQGFIDCDCTPDCSPDIGDFCELPDDCGKKKKENYSTNFTTKRDRKNNNKFKPKENITENNKKVDLNKK